MTENKIERYLIDLTISYREIGEAMYLIDDNEKGYGEIVIMYAEPLAVLTVTVMPAPKEQRLELFQKLLELNAKDVVHGAYALEDQNIVLIDTINYETMDLGDFRASLDGISLALTQHYPLLSVYRDK